MDAYGNPLARQRSALIPALVALMVIIGVLQLFVGILLYALAFPFPVCDGFFVVLAAMDFVVAVGLYKAQGWARSSALALGVLAAILNFPLGTIPAVILLIYLSKPEVKAAFGQGPPVYPPGWGYGPPYAPGPWAYPPPGYPPAQQAPPAFPPAAPPAAPLVSPAQRSSSCRNCGAPLEAGATFCRMCGTRIA